MFEHLAQSKKSRAVGPKSTNKDASLPGANPKLAQQGAGRDSNSHEQSSSHLKRPVKPASIAPNTAPNKSYNPHAYANSMNTGIKAEHEFPASFAQTSPTYTNAMSATAAGQNSHRIPPSSTFAPQSQGGQAADNMDDLSAMMFPSNDPLAYPKQPMLTLEQSGGRNQAMPFSQEFNPFVPASTNGAASVNADDQIDVQMFGPMPQYMQHSGDTGMGGFGSTATGFSSSIPTSHEQTIAGAPWDPRLAAQSMPGLTLEDFMSDPDWGSLPQD